MIVLKKDREIRSYNTKIIETESTIEIWKYSDPVYSFSNPYDKKNYDGEYGESIDSENSSIKKDNIEIYNSVLRMQKYYEQCRWDIARLVDTNFDSKTKFITLTFKENINDVSYTNKEFSKFIKRLNYYLYKEKKQLLKYIAVWELQERGAIHYHVIFFSLPYIKNSELQKIWGYGFVKINRIDVDSKENRGRYVSKYFSKNIDIKTYKQKSFFKSQNLIQPKVRKYNSYEPIKIKDNIIFSKEYNRKIPEIQDGKIISYNDSKVRYFKIKK